LRGSLAAARSVRHLPGVSASELAHWYKFALAFVLPSLSEGFGHVYMEALSSGCPVIGTRNTMLPGFAEAQDHIRYVEPGDPDSIRHEIERVADLPVTDLFFRTDAIRESFKGWSWKRFRDALELVLLRFDN